MRHNLRSNQPIIVQRQPIANATPTTTELVAAILGMVGGLGQREQPGEVITHDTGTQDLDLSKHSVVCIAQRLEHNQFLAIVAKRQREVAHATPPSTTAC